MRRNAIKNILTALITMGMSTTRIPAARAMLDTRNSFSSPDRYPERTSRVKCKGKRDASQRSRSNRRKAGR